MGKNVSKLMQKAMLNSIAKYDKGLVIIQIPTYLVKG